GHGERRVRADYADESDAVEVVPLGEHLGTDEKIERAVRECSQRFLELALGAGGVAIEASNARAGKFLAKAFFQVLRAFAEKVNVLGLAFGAELGDLLHGAAIVAFEAVAGFVVGHGDAAVFALHAGATTAAKDRPRVATAVDEDDRLRFVGETFLQAGVKRGADGAGLMGLLEIFAEVDDFDAGEWARSHA